MAQGRTPDPSSRPPKGGKTGKERVPDRDLQKIPDQDLQEINESAQEENPEWWRGDPGKRGEVL